MGDSEQSSSKLKSDKIYLYSLLLQSLLQWYSTRVRYDMVLTTSFVTSMSDTVCVCVSHMYYTHTHSTPATKFSTKFTSSTIRSSKFSTLELLNLVLEYILNLVHSNIGNIVVLVHVPR